MELLDLVLREIADFEALRHEPSAAARRQGSGERFEKRRLARAVGSEKTDALAGEQVPVEMGKDWRPLVFVAVAERDVGEPHELPRREVDCGKREFERTVDMRRGDALHPFKRLDPALRLLRLRGLGAEPVDECLQVRDLPLLLGVGRLLQGELQRALALELRVVAAVCLELLRVDVHDRRDDAIQKIAIVCDEEQRPGVADQPVFEPQHRVEVEVVRGLVQQEQVRAGHQRLPEIQPHP